MKTKILIACISLLVVTNCFAQFGFVKKADIDKIKDTRLIVVLYADSNYNASIKYAIERYWNFTGGFEFVYDTSTTMKTYNKPDFSFLIFARSKKSNKIKAKLASSDDDFNGLLLTKKYKKRAKIEDIVANAYCSNDIDTPDWHAEIIRGVQILNNFFNYAIAAENEKDITTNVMMGNYPGDLSTIQNKKLLVEVGNLLMKGKEDASFLYGNEVEEVEREVINKAIIDQDPEVVYVYSVCNEKFCDKLFVSAAGSEVMHFSSGSIEQRKVIAKDLKAVKQRVDKSNKQ